MMVLYTLYDGVNNKVAKNLKILSQFDVSFWCSFQLQIYEKYI